MGEAGHCHGGHPLTRLQSLFPCTSAQIPPSLAAATTPSPILQAQHLMTDEEVGTGREPGTPCSPLSLVHLQKGHLHSRVHKHVSHQHQRGIGGQYRWHCRYS